MLFDFCGFLKTTKIKKHSYTRVNLSAWLTIKRAEPIGITTTNKPKSKLLIKADKDGVIFNIYCVYNIFN